MSPAVGSGGLVAEALIGAAGVAAVGGCSSAEMSLTVDRPRFRFRRAEERADRSRLRDVKG